MSVAKYLKALLNDGTGIEKYVQGVSTSSGAANVNDIPILNSLGQLDTSFFPATLGSPIFMDTVATGVTLAAGNFTYFDPTNGTKQAIATSYATRAMAFVLSAFAAGTTCANYLAGINSALTSLTKGTRYALSPTTAGGVVTAIVASAYTSGNVRQELGDAMSTTALYFNSMAPAAVFL